MSTPNADLPAVTEGEVRLTEAEQRSDLTPTGTDALRTWTVRAGFSVRRRDAALAALDAFDAALTGDIAHPNLDAGVNAGPDVATALPGSEGAGDAPDEAKGLTTPAPASAYPHDDERCRQDSIDADGFLSVTRQLAGLAERLRVVEGERDAARAEVAEMSAWIEEHALVKTLARIDEWQEATGAELPGMARAAMRAYAARAESAEAAHAALVAGVEALAEEAAERAYMHIAVEKCLTVMRVGEGRAAVPGHWRDEAEASATVPVADLRLLLPTSDREGDPR